jgi:hypothetical protein
VLAARRRPCRCALRKHLRRRHALRLQEVDGPAGWINDVDPRAVAVRRECPVDVAAILLGLPASAVEPHAVRAGEPSDLDVAPSWKMRRHSGLVDAHSGRWLMWALSFEGPEPG